MAKAFVPQIVTANDLVEGDAVFLGPAGWVRDIALAEVAGDAAAAAALEAAGQAAEAANLVVGPYLVAVALAAGRPVPLLRREQIRADRAPTFDYAPAARVPAAAVARAA